MNFAELDGLKVGNKDANIELASGRNFTAKAGGQKFDEAKRLPKLLEIMSASLL